MQISVSSTLTLYHDGQFWVGVVEHVEDGELYVARIVFGAEPSDEEILQFIVRKWESLRFHGNASAEAPKPLAKNPKRRMREASKELSRRPVSTKSQQALSQAREAQKAEAKAHRTQARREAQETRFSQKQEKKKQKRKGH